jgi:ABC-type amino acid transport substrate-binding protein
MTHAGTIETLVPGRLTLCTYGGFAPVCYRDADGKLIGLDVAFLTAFAHEHDLHVGTIEQPFADIWKRPGQDLCDIAGAGVMERPERDVGNNGAWSDPYFEVKRSLLVRKADEAEFNDYVHLVGKKIVVTKGSTAETDARVRYGKCQILFVDDLFPDGKDVQARIVHKIMAHDNADAFGEGDVSNDYLRNTYGHGTLALADVHPIKGERETFNFIVRRRSTGLLAALNTFIAANKDHYAPTQA